MTDLRTRQPELATLRLNLRPLRPSDTGPLTLYASDPRVARMTTTIPHPYPPGLAEAFITRASSPLASETVWALDLAGETGNGLVGLISLTSRAPDTAEIGYWVAPAFWNAGYAGEAVEAVAAHARSLGLAALTAQVFQDNLASARVLTRAGFAYEGEGEAYSLARSANVATFRYVLSLR